MSKEWTPEEAIKVIAEVLRTSTYGQETDMTEEESLALADLISRKMEEGPQ